MVSASCAVTTVTATASMWERVQACDLHLWPIYISSFPGSSSLLSILHHSSSAFLSSRAYTYNSHIISTKLSTVFNSNIVLFDSAFNFLFNQLATFPLHFSGIDITVFCKYSSLFLASTLFGHLDWATMEFTRRQGSAFQHRHQKPAFGESCLPGTIVWTVE